MKRTILLSLLFLVGCSSSSVELDYQDNLETLEEEYADLQLELEELTTVLEDIEYENQLLIDENNNYEDLIDELNAKIEELEYLGSIPNFNYEENEVSTPDGLWDYNFGGTDRDADNDGIWDYDKGGTDRDLDNDGIWDYDKGGTDRDIN